MDSDNWQKALEWLTHQEDKGTHHAERLRRAIGYVGRGWLATILSKYAHDLELDSNMEDANAPTNRS